MIGLILFGLTFILAYVHLLGEIKILPVPGLGSSFGETLSPLIEAAIRFLYLGFLGLIASTVTSKGLNWLLYTKLQNNVGPN